MEEQKPKEFKRRWQPVRSPTSEFNESDEAHDGFSECERERHRGGLIPDSSKDRGVGQQTRPILHRTPELNRSALSLS